MLRLSAAYHSRTVEQSEGTIQSLEDLLGVCVLEQGEAWDSFLPLIMLRITTVSIQVFDWHLLRHCMVGDVEHLCVGMNLVVIRESWRLDAELVGLNYCE